jgi:hypothetical protein
MSQERDYPAFGRPDPNCPHADGYVIAKTYARSTLEDWWHDADDRFLGLIERLPGRPPTREGAQG